MQLRYKGSSDSYSINAGDLSRHGVEGFSKTVWSKQNNFTADVSQEAGAKLIELMPKDFEEAVDVDASASSEEDDSQSSSGKAKK